MRVCDVEKSS